MENNGSLKGVRVLDLTRVLAGPYCGMLLADMGADVIKVEVPGKGDDSRSMGPYINGQSVYYVNFNRSKRGCTLNLKEEKGKSLFKELVKKADILLENYRPGTMEKLGLGYEALKEINPHLIYGAVSGFGHSGPYSKRAGYDIVGQAMGGLMSTTGWPGGEPTRTGTPIGDVLGGLNLAIGVLAALHNREESGKGEKVDVSLVDSVVSAMTNINMIYLAEHRIPSRIGNRYESTYPYDSFTARDGNAIIAAGNDKLFGLLCDLMQQPDLKTDERFLTVTDRINYHEVLKERIEQWTGQYSVKELVQMVNDAGVPASPVYTLDSVVADEHIAGARNMFPYLNQTGIGQMRVTNCSQRFANTTAGPRKAAPLLGEDNIAIYHGLLGLNLEEIENLKREQVI